MYVSLRKKVTNAINTVAECRFIFIDRNNDSAIRAKMRQTTLRTKKKNTCKIGHDGKVEIIL